MTAPPREPTADDYERWPELRRLGETVRLTQRLAGGLTRAGGPSEPGIPAIRVARLDRDASLPAGTMPSLGVDPDEEIAPVLGALIDAARDGGAERVIIGWDPMDSPGHRLLAALGCRNSGRQPYFEIGGDQIEYVSGYTDPTGSISDWVWEPDAGPVDGPVDGTC